MPLEAMPRLEEPMPSNIVTLSLIILSYTKRFEYHVCEVGVGVGF